VSSEQSIQTANPTPPSPKSNQPSGKKIVLIGSIVVVGLVCLGVIGLIVVGVLSGFSLSSLMGASSPEDCIQAFLKCQQAGDFEGAAEFLYSEKDANNYVRELSSADARNLNYTIRGLKIIDVSKNQNLASVTVDVWVERNVTEGDFYFYKKSMEGKDLFRRITFSLRQDGGSWYISNLQDIVIANSSYSDGAALQSFPAKLAEFEERQRVEKEVDDRSRELDNIVDEAENKLSQARNEYTEIENEINKWKMYAESSLNSADSRRSDLQIQIERAQQARYTQESYRQEVIQRASDDAAKYEANDRKEAEQYLQKAEELKPSLEAAAQKVKDCEQEYQKAKTNLEAFQKARQ